MYFYPARKSASCQRVSPRMGMLFSTYRHAVQQFKGYLQ